MTGNALTKSEFRKNMILASTLLHTQPPTDVPRANCARILRHALIAAGLSDQRLEEGHSVAFHGNTKDFPEVRLWYTTLIELTRQEPASARLLTGAGNLELPAGACFTACWLTSDGRRFAEKLLVEHPEWKERLMADSW